MNKKAKMNMKPWYYFLGFKKREIHRNDNELYLVRYSWYPFGIHLKWFHLKIHNIVKDDYVCQHDHPWSFVSLILKGGYYEWVPYHLDMEGDLYLNADAFRYNEAGYYEARTRYKPGSFLYRKPEQYHRLQLIDGKPCWTVVITFKPVKDWNFRTPKGIIPWREYNHQNHCE